MRIPVELKLGGSFHQLAKFFYLVGNLDRIINIEDINLKTSNVEEAETILDAEVLATTFRSLQTNEAAKGTKKK
jgi:type IV pilus assembly protein PilO